MEHYLQLLYAIDTDDTYSRIIEQCLKLEEQHPESRDCYLFHQLIGSTPPPHLTQFDLSGKKLQNLIKAECRRVLTNSVRQHRNRARMLQNPQLGTAGKKLLKELMAKD